MVQLEIKKGMHSQQAKQVRESMYGEEYLEALEDLVLLDLPPTITPSLFASAAGCELSAYLDSDNVTAYEEDFDLLLWWRDHKLTFLVLSIMVRDILSVLVYTMSSKSYFSLTGRIIEERRRRLLPKHVEMLACIKDWELGERRLQHNVDNSEVEESFKNLYLDEDATGPPSASTYASASASVASASGT
jgi:hypothetical protein